MSKIAQLTSVTFDSPVAFGYMAGEVEGNAYFPKTPTVLDMPENLFHNKVQAIYTTVEEFVMCPPEWAERIVEEVSKEADTGTAIVRLFFDWLPYWSEYRGFYTLFADGTLVYYVTKE